MLGLSLSAFTTFHVILSLIGIFAGLVAVGGLIGNHWRSGWMATFLVTTIATSVTGFMFPFTTFGPAHVVGVISLIALAICCWALYGKRLAGRWRTAFVVTAVISLYLNVFVGIVQAFQKLSFLQPLAPTQSEPPFQVAQLLNLILFITAGFFAWRRFGGAPRIA